MALKFPRSPHEQAQRTLTITTHRTGHTTTIAAQGRIDLATEHPWHDALMTTATTDPTTDHLIVDLTAVTFLSWASTAVLLRAHRACTRRGRTLTIHARGPVLTGLQLTSLHDELHIVPATTPAPSPRRQAAASGWLIA
ncbi:hypothetical protein UO65_2686 [Actinokineospora spheciospongiae]|uniref:STAS domain-containing protein n=1 Tax=Actinokineospora spheciospongiae TaxID=909613 RepID=W7IM36_9PSEU|nr:STAS domain-containing protein [Actinokineospora spheciospongiae]EWC61975.1 hypothetical protein UO65_2686 [Actinokineospora spheciospongiae]PWW63528.1 anti-anti-sigma factor [Actinokineospora spheciospongiae]